jgi:hypothetical protein
MGPLVVLHDNDQRRTLCGRKVQSFVKRARGADAITDPSQCEDFLP